MDTTKIYFIASCDSHKRNLNPVAFFRDCKTDLKKVVDLIGEQHMDESLSEPEDTIDFIKKNIDNVEDLQKFINGNPYTLCYIEEIKNIKKL